MPNRWWTYRRMISWLECPHLLEPDRRAERERMMHDFGGPDSPYIQSMLFGRFQRANTVNTVFSNIDLEAVKRAMKGMGTAIEGKRRAAIDFSGGGDAQVLMTGEGTKVTDIQEWHERNELVFAKTCVSWFQDHGILPFDVIADAGGMGSTCLKFMEHELKFVGMRHYLHNQNPRTKYRFFDRNTEDHWRLKRLFMLGQIEVPFNETLLEQMRLRRFVEMEHEKIKVEPKNILRGRGEDSPDHLDTLVMLMSDVPVVGYNDDGTPQAEGEKPWKGVDDKPGKEQRMGNIFHQDRPSIWARLGKSKPKFTLHGGKK